MLTISRTAEVPLLLNIAVTSAYFLAQFLVFSATAVYAFFILFEHAARQSCLPIAVTVVCILGGALVFLVLVNFWTGWLFRFAGTEYVRSPLNRAGYGVLLAKEHSLFYLDDFGVGYSNFSGVMSLPFETVSLDASLLQDVERDQKAYQTIRLLVQMLRSVSFSVVAEGVEREEQARCIRKLGADRIQGHYYARPIPELPFWNPTVRRTLWSPKADRPSSVIKARQA